MKSEEQNATVPEIGVVISARWTCAPMKTTLAASMVAALPGNVPVNVVGLVPPVMRCCLIAPVILIPAMAEPRPVRMVSVAVLKATTGGIVRWICSVKVSAAMVGVPVRKVSVPADRVSTARIASSTSFA